MYTWTLSPAGFCSGTYAWYEAAVPLNAAKRPLPCTNVVAETKADAKGHWVLRKAPAGWVRVVVEAQGFVPRVAGYARFDEQPHVNPNTRTKEFAVRDLDVAIALTPDVALHWDGRALTASPGVDKAQAPDEGCVHRVPVQVRDGRILLALD